MNNVIPEMKNTLEGINSRITDAEEQGTELEDRKMEVTTKEQKKDTERTEVTLRDLWDNIKCINIQIIGVLQELKKKALRKYFKRL